MTRLIIRLLSSVLVCALLIVGAAVLYRLSGKADMPLIFSSTQLLNATWLTYKTEYVEAGTYRTIDPQRGSITTSEGQSYTMLRAVWLGDKQTFDGAWGWTKTNLYHTNDHLFAWLWGQKPDGTYGVLTAQDGEASASDADTDIALSLIFAYARWQDPAYLDAARGIVGDIWNKEVIEINGTPYLTADDVEKSSASAYAAIDPSYLNPAAYRIFAEVDPTHPWAQLVDSSYHILQQSIQSPLDKGHSANLPPDWIEINKQTGALQAMPSTADTTNFGFDALRVPFRLALDWAWFKDPRDTATLQELSFLGAQWNTNQTLASTYTHDGSVVVAAEAPAMYGGTIGYFMLAAPTLAQSVYEQKLVSLYDPGTEKWEEPLSYYDDNWAWFGIALYNGQLPNLAANLPAAAFRE
jgi:endo-1,4-beta-D-glucanase Y